MLIKMLFSSHLFSGKLLKREKRVLVDVLLDDGRVVTSYCPYFGLNKDFFIDGMQVYISRNINLKRRLKFVLEQVVSAGNLVCINQTHNVPIVAEAIMMNKIPELSCYEDMSLRVDTPISPMSGIDILLYGGGDSRPCYVGINSVFLKRKADAIFPDEINVKRNSQLKEMAEAANEGARVVLFLLVGRMDCLAARMVWDIDPVYAGMIHQIKESNIEIICYSCSMDFRGIWLDKPIPIYL